EVSEMVDRQRAEGEHRSIGQAAAFAAHTELEGSQTEPEHQPDSKQAQQQPRRPTFDKSLEVVVVGMLAHHPNLLRASPRHGLCVLERPVTRSPDGELRYQVHRSAPQGEARLEYFPVPE